MRRGLVSQTFTTIYGATSQKTVHPYIKVRNVVIVIVFTSVHIFNPRKINYL